MNQGIDIKQMERGKSFWREAYDKVMRDRLALCGLAVIWTIASVAVWTPLLAGSRPYMIEAVFAENYENAYWVWLDSHEMFLEATDAEQQNKNAQLILTHLDTIARHVAPDAADELARCRGEYETLLVKAQSGPLDDEMLGSFDALMEAIELPYDPEVIALTAQRRYPALRALTLVEVGFMALWLFVHIAYIAPPLRFHATSYLVAAALAVVCAITWRAAVTPVLDPVNYRAIIEAEGHASGLSYLTPPVFYGENENLTAEAGLPPTWWWKQSEETRAKATHYHWMGTDDLGKDVLCRMIYGARVSMVIGLVAVSIYVAIGIVVGAIAGYFGGWVDIGVSRVIEVMMCFPVFFLILAIVAYARPSIITIMVVLGVTGWTGTARLQRGEFLRLSNQDFVQAVRALGGSHIRIIFRHILPNGIAPILVLASFGIAAAILTESALSYLGFGVPQPHASWGNLLQSGARDIQRLWWLILFPGAAIFVTITAWNLFGETLRDALDPKLRE